MSRAAFVVLLGAVCAAGCGFEGPEVEAFATPIPQRHGTILINGCALDAGQTATVSQATTKAVAQEIILLCGAVDAAGDVGTYDGTPLSALGPQISSLKALGYTVRVGVGLAVGVGTASLNISQAQWTAAALSSIATLPAGDGLELALNQDDALGLLAPMVDSLRMTSGASYIGALVSAPIPSVPPIGEGWANLNVDRMRILTVDFSPAGLPGPALDSGWAVDVASAAQAALPGLPIDITVPLVGTEFLSNPGDVDVSTSAITFADAESTAAMQGTTPVRGPTGTLHFAWTAPGTASLDREAWFDDATSISRALHAWDTTTLAPDVGVVFYGLGGEDPATFSTIVGGMQ